MIHFASPLLLASLLGAGTQPIPEPQKVWDPVRVDSSATNNPPRQSARLLHKIAFGSCNKVQLPQPMWRKILEEKPDLWIWTGDAIYGDTEDMGLLSQIYAQQLKQPEYAALLATHVPVIGTYDDHDFGGNDADADYPKKKESMQLFLDFLNEPKSSPRRQQPGVYTSYRFGPQGQRVKVVLTDNRYNRQKPGPKTDLLGAKQWAWLEKEINRVDAEVLVIVSGTQILPFEHEFEKWGEFPQARQRIIKLLDKTRYKNIVLISGDRHVGEMSKFTLPSGRVIWEVTSSGLTHSYRDFSEQRSPNSLRSGAVLPRLNYGLLNIRWDGATPEITVEIRDINRQPILQETIPLKR